MTFWREIAHLFQWCQQAALHVSSGYFPGTMAVEWPQKPPRFILNFIPTHSLLSAGVAFVEMILIYGSLSTLSPLVAPEPSKEFQNVIASFLSIFIFILPYHFIICISWISSQLKDGQAFQETRAKNTGSPQHPTLISVALPATATLSFSVDYLSLLWHAEQWPFHNSLVPISFLQVMCRDGD